MTMRYDKETDTLTIIVGTETYESYELEAGDFAVVIDEGNDLIEIAISNATKFVAQVLALGIPIENAPAAKPNQSGMVWYDADSSMISAFGYDETTQILEVAFHRTGVYRYYDVPKDVFEGLRDASSKGSYMRGVIIDTYPYEKKRGRSRR